MFAGKMLNDVEIQHCNLFSRNEDKTKKLSNEKKERKKKTPAKH